MKRGITNSLRQHYSGNTAAILLFITAFILGGIFFYNKAQNPCSIPITYTIGSIDKRFDTTKERVRQLAESAEQVWEKALGVELFIVELFIYDEVSKLPINLIFDSRQQTTLEEQEMRAELDKKDARYTML